MALNILATRRKQVLLLTMVLPWFVAAPLGAQGGIAASSPSPSPSEAATAAHEQQDGEAERSLTSLSAAIGEVVQVRTRADGPIAGTLVSVSDAELTVAMGIEQRRLASEDVVEVVRARRSSLWRRGLLIGVGAGALAGAIDCSRSTAPWQREPSCPAAIGQGVVVGGGIGVLTGFLVKRDDVLYSAPGEASAIPLTARAAPGSGKADDEDTPPRAVTSLAELPTVVKPLDTLDVRLTGRRRISGQFVGATASDLTIAVDGREVTLPVGEVRDVRVRWRRMWRRGMLVGALSGAGVGATLFVLSATNDEELEWAPFGMMVGGATGLGLGTLFGTLAYDRALVYPGRKASLSVSPAVSPTRMGVHVAVAF